MSASSLSIATISTSSSLSLSNKFPSTNLPFEPSFISIPTTHFKPKLTLRIKTHYPSFSLLSHSSAASFDGTQVIEITESVQEDEIVLEEDDELEEEDEGIESESEEAGRLYVGNLPYAMTSSQLAEVFGESGHIVSSEIVYDRVTDRSRGFAFVTMASVQEAKEAIRMFDGSQVGGRTVRVNFPEVPRGGEREVMGPKIRSSYQGYIDSPHKIYAGNLSWLITSQALKEAFADQPGLLSAKVIYERHSGRSRGFGFVTFGSPEEAQSALNAMNGVEVEGRPLRLNLAQERAPTSSPSRLEENNVDTSEILLSVST